MSRPRTHSFSLSKNGARISVEFAGLDKLTPAELQTLWGTVEANVLPRKSAVEPCRTVDDLLEREA